MTTGKQIVYLYDGVLPKSGKQVTQFADHTLIHRSIKGDKSDLLVHLESRVIIRSYPLKTDRSVILDDLAANFKRLEHFLRNPESYEVRHKPKADEEKVDADAEVVYNIEHEPSYSRSGKYAHLNKDEKFKQEYKLPLMKKYNQRNFKW